MQIATVSFLTVNRMSEITRRKVEHIQAVLEGNATANSVTTGLEHIRFEHNALPDLNLCDIDLATDFLGRSIGAPLLISSMTGGPDVAGMLNLRIAEASQTLNIPFGVGSQRIALEGGSHSGFGPDLRRAAPDVPILANFGAAQLQSWEGPTMARRAVDMIEADALIIHLNPLQEAVQFGGDTNWGGLLEKIAVVAGSIRVPVVVKEVGAGISGAVAKRLCDVGVAAIDVAGVGGTSWAAVEGQRASSGARKQTAEVFRDWGISTAEAICQVRGSCPKTTLIASGGLRDGLDCAKAIRLGADLAAMAAGVLPAAMSNTESLVAHLQNIIDQLRIACFCTGSGDLAQLRCAPLIASPT
ncbi:MAG: type 2 isopentenyl-diphosphate Delta-isomerase [Hyphomicrobiaceae bacterium]